MKDIMKLALRLIIITVIAGLLLGLTYAVTKDGIAEQQAIAAQQARETVLPAASVFESMDVSQTATGDFETVNEVYVGKDASGNTIGATINLLVNGFSPNLNITVGINADGSISGVQIGSHEETPGLGAKAQEPEYLSQYAEKAAPFTIVKVAPSSDAEIQAVTGATITSRAVAGAVNTASEFYMQFVSGEAE